MTSRPARRPKCLDVTAWRVPTRSEHRDYIDSLRTLKTGNSKGRRGSILAVRHSLSPVDIYCYLKARFGKPNGFQTFIAKDDSDNLFHWDYNLKVGSEDVYVVGAAREIHFHLSEKLSDSDWQELIARIKSDFVRIGPAKSKVFSSLEKWVVFQNRFVQVANVCAELHSQILENIGEFEVPTPKTRPKKQFQQHIKAMKILSERAGKLYSSCLQLSILTPVFAEAFLNMIILIFCKKEIRSNRRQLDAFLRSHIDAKVFDIPYKCYGFSAPIDQNNELYKSFKRVMDKRNNLIHGNIDPIREAIETVYFEGKRPLFTQQGDHILEFMKSLERQYDPSGVVKDYEQTYEFLLSFIESAEVGMEKELWQILSDPYPGYEAKRQITGALFPRAVYNSYYEGLRYDDELAAA